MKSAAYIFLFSLASGLLLSCDKDDNSNSVVNDNDVLFAKKASISNFTEITLGQIAADSATDPSIKQFGAQMVTEHTAAQQRLEAITSGLGIDATGTLDAEHQQLLSTLLTLKGSSFDSVYIHSQVADHENTIDFFKQHSAHGLQKDVKQYVYETLPAITEHLKLARTLSTKF